MKEYTICNYADKEIFHKQCTALETHVPGIKKAERLHDVDDSIVQFYVVGEHTIEVRNDEYIGYVGVKTDMENLESFFKVKNEK